MPLLKRRLGWSGEQVSAVCLGTMTFGVQSSEEDAHSLLDYYVKERGGNLLDTAEMYPAPSSDPTWKPGRSEEIIGTWMAKNRDIRRQVLIATKVSGFNPCSETAGNRKITLERGGKIDEATGLPEKAPCRLDRASILEACEASLKRLQVDCIDLYQIHWPDRYVPLFGALAYDVAKERPDSVAIEETVLAMKELIDAGKIRYYGLSNETTFGVCTYCQVADRLGAPRPVSIQNQFSLLYRPFESELAEACAPRNYDIALLPWTPLGGGILTQKYLSDEGKLLPPEQWPASRFRQYPKWMSRFADAGKPQCGLAVERYALVAKSAGISLTDLALKFCRSRWYAASSIIGATHLDQLRENLDAFEESSPELSKDVLRAIDEIHMASQNPIMSM
eukprot:TRINITY_DN38927_c0_g1_i1.p1 TRINITY_DN38927_c0_g1~~TRINITY_DN38927_c0_g1_i1.p1  ORF type:complete len:455 (-),score=60.39 TRINITY_DN38927_c0_g1_i1:38-1213(-)